MPPAATRREPADRRPARGRPRVAQPARRAILVRRQDVGASVHASTRSYKRRGQAASRPARQDRPAAAVQVVRRWNENDKGGATARLRNYVERVEEEQPGSVPQIVVMRHQGKACHKRYTAGGAAEDERTKRWYDQFARGIGDARVVIGFEPDSLGTIDCLALSAARRASTRCATASTSSRSCPTRRSTSRPAPPTGSRAERTAKQLRYIGIAKVRGFMLNVTHDDWTAANIKHGLDDLAPGGRQALHRQHLRQRPRAGALPALDQPQGPEVWRRVNVWCHAAEARPRPGADHRDAAPDLVDAYLYVNRPGYSGGVVQRRSAADRLLVGRPRAGPGSPRDRVECASRQGTRSAGRGGCTRFGSSLGISTSLANTVRCT